MKSTPPPPTPHRTFLWSIVAIRMCLTNIHTHRIANSEILRSTENRLHDKLNDKLLEPFRQIWAFAILAISISFVFLLFGAEYSTIALQRYSRR